VPAGLLLSQRQMRSSNGLLAWIALGVATLAGLAMIAIGRAGDYGGQVDAAKFSRYSELSFLMIPVIAVLWWNVLAGFPRLRIFALVAYWIACIAAYRDDLSFQPYQYVRNSRLEM